MKLCCFFSSRRRHTRYWRDWSSDVCSSDLDRVGAHGGEPRDRGRARGSAAAGPRLRAREGGEPAARGGAAAGAAGGVQEIGRASCWERVEISVVALPLKK